MKTQLRDHLNELKRYFYRTETALREKKEVERNRILFLHQVHEHRLSSVEEAHKSYLH